MRPGAISRASTGPRTASSSASSRRSTGRGPGDQRLDGRGLQRRDDLGPGGRARPATGDPKAVLEQLDRQSLDAPEGIVTIDPDSWVAWRPFFVGKARADGQFDVVWSITKPIHPVTYVVTRPKAQWDALLDELKARWGGRWSSSEPIAPEPDPAGSMTERSVDVHRPIDRHRCHYPETQARPRMSLRSLLPDRNSIATRLAGWFLLIALVPCVFLLAVTAYFSRRSLEATVRQRLMVICDAKAAQLEEFISERKSDARYLANAPGFVEAATRLGRDAQGGQGGRPRNTGASRRGGSGPAWPPSPTPIPTRISTCSTPTAPC